MTRTLTADAKQVIVSPVLKSLKPGAALTHWHEAMAGDSVFTLVSGKTGARYTYRVKHKAYDGGARHFFFASVLYGPDNISDYVNIGVVNMDTGRLMDTRTTPVDRRDPRVLALEWFLTKAASGNDAAIDHQAEFILSVRCIMCGRPLTVPSSVHAFIGPKCAQRI